MTKTLEELRNSSYHQQLSRKMCAAFVAQQQGIALSTAFKKTEEPIGDLSLMLAEFAVQAVGKAMDVAFRSDTNQRSSGPIM